MKTFSQLVVLIIAGALVSSCSSTGYEKAGGTSTSLQRAAQAIDKGNARIDAVLASLFDLVNNPGTDLKKQFKKFSSEVDDLKSLAKEVGDKVDAMQKEGASYFQQWNEDLAKIQNEDIRTRSTERKNNVAVRFEAVKTSYTQVKTAFTPFMSVLEDIRTALSADLTAGGLESVKGVVSKADHDAMPLRESLSKLSADFRTLGVSLSATTPQPVK